MRTAQKLRSVFLSHAAEDQELAWDIARRLRSAGLTVITAPEPPTPSQDQRASVREAIRHADAVISLVTPAALKSDWTMVELGMADGADKVVLPVIAGLANQPLPLLLRAYRTVPYDRLDAAIRRLTRQLAEVAEFADE